MSRIFERLKLVQGEYDVARAAVDYLEREWPRLHTDPAFRGRQMAKIRDTSANLEATYLIRLFTAFEAILREVVPSRRSIQTDRRSAYDLINQAASRFHMKAGARDEAHRVRQFRNLAVHQGMMSAPVLRFTEALAILSRFLAWIPNPP